MLNVMITNETIVMSVGGSLIVPDQIDTTFLTNLKNIIVSEAANGRRFIIIAGGGRTARRYQDAADSVTTLTRDDLDWLGIHATHLNGHLLLTIFRELAYHVMIKNPDDILDVPGTPAVVVAAGYRPGSSTDLRAVQIAERVQAHKVINLSNTDYIYTDNPHTNPEAVAITDMTWEELRGTIPQEWDPGMSVPFDPVAAREAEQLKLEIAQINGDKLEELRKYLNNEPFIGTRIHPSS
jgi:uridylate kinase